MEQGTRKVVSWRSEYGSTPSLSYDLLPYNGGVPLSSGGWSRARDSLLLPVGLEGPDPCKR